ncbi:putative aminotransferase [bacterium HR39]|nr:putative aminotransferase [bacterium HR39]
MSYVFHRHLHEHYPVVAGGEGCWLIDAEGRRYLDASGGAAVSCLGHNHPQVQEAIIRQVREIAYAHTAFFTSRAAEELAEHLVTRAPGDFARVYFVSGGSEAVEAALKMARQYFVEIGEPQRTVFVARRQSYHGTTVGALSVGGNFWRRRPFQPLLRLEVEHVSPCYAYRGREPGESEEAYGRRLVRELEETLERVGPERVIAFVAEPVVGATMGAVPAVPGYFRGIRELCDRHGILLILDEVMCGMGRIGTLYAFEQEGVVPDLGTMAKGLGGGYQPVGAVLARRKIVEAIARGSGFFQHGHTYMGHPTACAAALAVQRVIERDGLLARVREMGEALRERLEARFGQHPHVGDVRGRGLFRGLELVEDRETQRPFPPATRLHARIQKRAMAEGLICYPMGGTIDGEHGHHVLLAPPFVISEDELDLLVERLARAIDGAIAELRG